MADLRRIAGIDQLEEALGAAVSETEPTVAQR
jgi:hypothetical protein